MTTDEIHIEALAFEGPHGWFDHERRDGVRFELDACLAVDTRAAAASDALGDTVDYAAVTETLLAVAHGPSCKLLERLIDLMCAAVLAGFPRVEAITLTLRKLEAPLAAPARSVAIRVHRRRERAS